MSVQLIVYPQSYDGQFNALASTSNEFVVDGLLFNTINASSSYDTPSLLQTAIDNQPPSVVNTWYRYRTTGSGTPTLPTEVSGNLTLYSVSTQSLCGVYQKLSNLVVGNVYEIVIDVSTTGAGLIVPTIYDGSTLVAATIFSAGSSQVTYSFTATSVNQIIVISYSNTTADNIVIDSISVSEQGITPTATYSDLQDGQVICDLYEDEDIPLTLSVDDFKNVAEKVQSYSKAFNLPATKRNNKIFDNIFEITRTDTELNFNPYKRTKAILKQDGFLLFEGYLRMLDISDKSGEISYNVNLYSEVIALADVLGDKTFSELDFTELEHNYNRTEIQHSWNDAVTGITYTHPSTSGFRDAYSTVKYPFVNWDNQISLAGTGTTATEDNPQLSTLETAFRPFINIKYLIDRVFQATDFTYESAFFNTADFKKLYMDFNWGSNASSEDVTEAFFTSAGGTILSTTSYQNYVFDDDANFNPNLNWVSADNEFVALNDNTQYNVDFFVSIKKAVLTPTGGIDFRLAHKNSSGVVINTFVLPTGLSTITGTGTTFGDGQIVMQTGDTLAIEWKSDVAGEYKQRPSSLAGTPTRMSAVIGQGLVTTNSLLQNLRGELGQWSFLKGLLTMFNLVTLPDEDNPSNIKIEPYADVFIPTATAGDTLADRGIQHDWTEKIDISEMKLMPLTDLNKKTIFKFVEDEDDYAFMNYKNSVGGHLYGSKKYNAGNKFNILVGEDEIIAEPFAATVVKPLMSQFSDFITPAVYSLAEDGTSEGFDNSPRIMYNNGIKSDAAGTFVSCTYFMPAQNGVVSTNQDKFLQFSHLSDVPTVAGARDFHFGQCQLLSAGSSVPDNLFNLYWLPYYTELYNPAVRIMTIKVNLSPSDINTFKFNDTIFIKNRTFRVNKIDYKPNDLATVEFILIP